MNFKPKSKETIKNEIKDILLTGSIIRYDFIDENPLEVLDRKYTYNLPNMSNIGQCSKPIMKIINCNHKLLHEVTAELNGDYSVREIECKQSGCCQHATYGVYIE